MFHNINITIEMNFSEEKILEIRDWNLKLGLKKLNQKSEIKYQENMEIVKY